MFYKVKNVIALENFKLLVEFENSVKKCYDVGKLFNKYEDFKALSTIKNLFEQVQVDVGGYGISWNDDIDLSCNELYKNGGEI